MAGEPIRLWDDGPSFARDLRFPPGGTPQTYGSLYRSTRRKPGQSSTRRPSSWSRMRVLLSSSHDSTSTSSSSSPPSAVPVK